MASNIIQGSTGIIIHNTKYATKWFYDIEDYSHEAWGYSNILQEIDPRSKFTPKFIDTNYEPIPSELIGYFQSNASPFAHSLTMEYTGPSLYDIMTSKDRLYSNLNLDRFTRALYKLMNGLQQLQAYQMIHCDIKPTNITYHIETNVLKLIDFGWLYPYNEMYQPINNSTSYLGIAYKYFPPEFKITYVFKACKKRNLRLPTQQEFKDHYLIPYFKSYGSAWNRYLEYYPYVMEDLSELYQRAKRRFIKSHGENIFQGPLEAIDAFGIGLTLLEFLSRIKNKASYTSTCYKYLTQAIFGLIHPNPHYRITIEQASNILYEYLVRRFL